MQTAATSFHSSVETPWRDAAPAINPSSPLLLLHPSHSPSGSNCGPTRSTVCMARVLHTLRRFSVRERGTDENSTLEIRRTYVARNAPQESYRKARRALAHPPRPAPIFRPFYAGPPSRAELPRSSRQSGCAQVPQLRDGGRIKKEAGEREKEYSRGKERFERNDIP